MVESRKGISTSRVAGLEIGITHSAPPETVEMNKYHLMLAFERIQSRPKGPSLDQVAVPFVFAAGLLFALLPADFKEFMGIPAATWQAFAMLCLLVSLGLGFYLLYRWNECRMRYPTKTADDYYSEIIEQMAKDRAIIENLERPGKQ